MVLKIVVESLSDLSSDIQAEYEQREDGKYQLLTEAADGLSVDTAQQYKSELAKAVKKHETATSKLERFNDLDPVAAREALGKVEEMRNWTPEQQVADKLAATEKAWSDKFDSELKTRDDKITKQALQIKDHVISRVALEAIADAGGTPQLLMPIIERNTTVEEDEHGNYVARVTDTNGTPRISMVTGNTDKMTVAEYVGELRKDAVYKRCFEGSGAAGGGEDARGEVRTLRKGSTISRNDQSGINNSIEAIAKGDVTVVD